MKKLNRVKIPKWVQMAIGFIVALFEYLLYFHDRIVMSWTVRTLARIDVWSDIKEYKQYAIGRVVIIWGLYGLYLLIF